MNLILNGDLIIWIPIHEINNPVYSHSNYLIFNLIYFFLLSISAYFTLILVVTSWKIQKFHRNMTINFSFYFATWFECWLGLVLVWPYKVGLILVDDTNRKFSNFETTDLNEMPRISNYSNATFLLFGSFLIWHYLASTVAGMSNFVIERAVASFFFQDYERKQRNYIGYSLLASSQFCVIQGSVLIFLYCFSLKFLIIFVSFLLAFVILTFVYLLYYNISLRNYLDIKQSRLSYNLAARFQAAENARSLKLAVCVFAVICFLFAIALIIMTTVLFDFVPECYNYAIMAAFECVFALNPLFVVPAAMFSVPEWKLAFFKWIPFLSKRRFSRNGILNQENRVEMETKMYFVQLEDSWKT